MPYTLVVVDMQSAFHAALKPSAIVGVTCEILAAKKLNRPVMLVEYAKCGPTLEPLAELLRGYPKKLRVTKPGDDGSRQVIRALQENKWPSKYLRVCGVNTDCCVWSTVEGLLEKLPDIRIEVVKNACEWTGTKKFDWRTYLRHPNLKLA